MADVPLERRFHGSINLTILHLRRVALSNDIDEGLAAAKARKMINDDNEAFIRRMFDLDAQLQAGEELSEPITEEFVKELQACCLRLNMGDSA